MLPASTPPVGTKRMEAKGPERASSIATPPEASAGKNLTASRPLARPRATPSGFEVPGSTGRPRSRQKSTTPSSQAGQTTNLAPASTACFAMAVEVTVPAPTRRPGTLSAIARMASGAALVRKVTSATGMPPATRAFPSPAACAASSIFTTGTIPISPILLIISFMETSCASSLSIAHVS